MIVFFHFAPTVAFFISAALGLLARKSWINILIYSIVFYLLFYILGFILTHIYITKLKGSEEKDG